MKKINNKILIIALVVLVGIFVASKVFRSPRLESNLRKELVEVDTAAITEIRIQQSPEEKAFKLTRTGKIWNVESDKKKYTADTASVSTILNALAEMKAERMVSRKKEKWESFNVGEKSANVSVYYGSDEKASIHIGKSGFNQSSTGGFSGAYTYVRVNGENETYAVNGFLESTFNRSLSDFRDKSFLRIPKDKISKISFSYPADSGFVLEKKDTIWQVAGQKAKKDRVDSYLEQLSYKNLDTFADDFKPQGKAEASIRVEGASGILGTTEAWRRDSTWTFRSSLQKDYFFSGSSVDKNLLVGAKNFTTSAQ